MPLTGAVAILVAKEGAVTMAQSSWSWRFWQPRRTSGSRPQQRSAGPRWCRPWLEALEDRTLLSNFDFAGLAQDLRDKVASPIQSLLQQARAIPFVGQQLATVAQVIQPVK